MVETNLQKITCCACYVPFWVSTQHQERLINSKESFYCPSGHAQHYSGRTDAERIREEKDAVISSLEKQIKHRDDKIKELDFEAQNKCVICNKKYTSKFNLNRHRRKKHGL